MVDHVLFYFEIQNQDIKRKIKRPNSTRSAMILNMAFIYRTIRKPVGARGSLGSVLLNVARLLAPLAPLMLTANKVAS